MKGNTLSGLCVLGLFFLLIIALYAKEDEHQTNIKEEIKAEAEVKRNKYLADDARFWEIVERNGGVKNEDTIDTVKNIEDMERQLDFTNCTLLGLCMQEARFDRYAVNENGWYGCFQINMNVHKVRKSQVFEIDKAAKWITDNLKKNGYDEFVSGALVKHFGGANIYSSSKAAIASAEQSAYRVIAYSEKFCGLKD